ncbi:hypothetical protein acsn021_35500 [Anaerocolumna cellulosilytica]|uniref:Uncharacterized protein n=1 Tax=Anaerocolumna cellulosilytica TaxID=433286 RepID=A0A6S6RAX1_9FIRM|nr:hypothetical protein acsn021_35500 [Anaerocolumna cellulosilytica]
MSETQIEKCFHTIKISGLITFSTGSIGVGSKNISDIITLLFLDFFQTAVPVIYRLTRTIHSHSDS